MNIITYWNHMKRTFGNLECESANDKETVEKVMKRNGWECRNGVWYFNK